KTVWRKLRIGFAEAMLRSAERRHMQRGIVHAISGASAEGDLLRVLRPGKRARGADERHAVERQDGAAIDCAGKNAFGEQAQGFACGPMNKRRARRLKDGIEQEFVAGGGAQQPRDRTTLAEAEML